VHNTRMHARHLLDINRAERYDSHFTLSFILCYEQKLHF
jgi:hypothetical protein